MDGPSQKTKEEVSIAEEVEKFLRNQQHPSGVKNSSIKQIRGSKVEVISKDGGRITKRIITL